MNLEGAEVLIHVWDVGAALAWLYERMVETWQTLGAFGKGLFQFF